MSNETEIIVCNNEKSIGEIPRPIRPRWAVCMPIPGYLSAFLPCTDAIFIDDAPTKNPYDVWNNSIGHFAVGISQIITVLE